MKTAEGGHDRHGQHPDEHAENVAVQNSGEAEGRCFHADLHACRGRGGGQRLRPHTREPVLPGAPPASQEFPPAPKTSEAPPQVIPRKSVERSDHQALVPVAAPQQEGTEHAQNDVRRPTWPARGEVDRSLAASLSVPQQDVVEEEDADRHEETGRAAAPPVPETERDSVEPEHQTGRRDGELLVDSRPTPCSAPTRSFRAPRSVRRVRGEVMDRTSFASTRRSSCRKRLSSSAMLASLSRWSW